ncbi:MAG TPA: GntR family transcriptional regulator [Chloroflexota bacterium]
MVFVERRGHRTLRERVLAQITERIVCGVYPPGLRLVESELAQEMGVSRSPVREALRQLEEEGLVVNLPGASTVVAPVSLEDAEELYEIREALETVAVRHAAELLRAEDAELLRAVVARMRQVYGTGDIAETTDVDMEFHRLLWQFSRRPGLISMLKNLERQTRRYVLLTRSHIVTFAPLAAVEEHERLAEAVLRRDPDAAERCAREHLRRGGVRMRRALEAVLPRGEASIRPGLDDTRRPG